MYIFNYFIITIILLVECYLCFRIAKNPFEEEEDSTNANNYDDGDFLAYKGKPVIENPDNPELKSEFWQTNGQIELDRHLSQKLNKNVAKNVIFFIGDGMSLTTLAATRNYLGHLQNRTGEEISLSFEQFPGTGLAKTYCVDQKVADSACSGTALFTGVKTNYATLGVTAQVKKNDCKASLDESTHLNSIVEWAQRAGKATGIITNTGITSATPAAAYAHAAYRKYECDADVLQNKQDPKQCLDIASQLIYGNPGKNLNVIFGGGRSKFLPKATKNETVSSYYAHHGERKDGKNLIDEWIIMKNKTGKFISNRKGLSSLNLDGVNHVLGLFGAHSLPFALESDPELYPSLAEMTLSAIKILKKVNPENGYVLLVEGGRIDHAHHNTQAHLALDETVQLSDTVQQTVDVVDERNTLIVVSSDHAHTMTFAGYSPRGGNVLGIVSQNVEKAVQPYTVLSYANGPGFNSSQINIRTANTSDIRFHYPATIPLKRETHGGEDVGVFARGPWSHLFTGVYEQHVIPHFIGYAACIGDGKTVCKESSPTVVGTKTGKSNRPV